jgi:hypothetical protein
MTPWMELREVAFIMFYVLIGMCLLYWAYDKVKTLNFEKGYWSGRNDGWRASLQHQERIRRMRNDEVFDYEKN